MPLIQSVAAKRTIYRNGRNGTGDLTAENAESAEIPSPPEFEAARVQEA